MPIAYFHYSFHLGAMNAQQDIELQDYFDDQQVLLFHQRFV